MTRLKWNLISVCLVIVLVSVQERCTVCAKQVSEIVSEAPDAKKSAGSFEPAEGSKEVLVDPSNSEGKTVVEPTNL